MGFSLDVQKTFDDVVAAYADKTITLQELTTIVSDFSHVVAEALADFTGTQADYDSFVADCEATVAAALAKITIPGVPGFVQGYVKSALVQMVRPLLDHLRPVHKMGLK